MQKREERPSARVQADPFLDQALALQIIQLAVISRLDTIAQMLFSAGLIADILPRLLERDPQEGLIRQVELTLLTRRTLAEVHNLLVDLHRLPPDDGERSACSAEGISGAKEP